MKNQKPQSAKQSISQFQSKAQVKGYNRNISGGKRRHRGITKYAGMTLAQRVVAESKAFAAYKKRTNQK